MGKFKVGDRVQKPSNRRPTMPRYRRYILDGPCNEDGAIIVDGVRMTKEDIESLLAVLDPGSDQETWDYYYRKWLVLAQQNEREGSA